MPKYDFSKNLRRITKKHCASAHLKRSIYFCIGFISYLGRIYAIIACFVLLCL